MLRCVLHTHTHTQLEGKKANAFQHPYLEYGENLRGVRRTLYYIIIIRVFILFA